MFQQLQSRQVNMSRQEQQQTLKTERLLIQVRRTLEALEHHVGAVQGTDAVEKHKSNVALVAQCNVLNAQTSLAKMRGDKEGLVLGLQEVQAHERSVSDEMRANEPIGNILNNYYGYMNSVLSGNPTEPLPTVSVDGGADFEETSNDVFSTFLGAVHGAGERTQRMEEDVENIRSRQREKYASSGGRVNDHSRHFDAQAMTGYMAGKVSTHGQSKNGNACAYNEVKEEDVGSFLMGDDTAMLDGGKARSIRAGDKVHVRGNRGVFQVFRVDKSSDVAYVIIARGEGQDVVPVELSQVELV